MTLIDELQAELETTNSDLAETETAVSAAPEGELSRLGGLLAGLTARRKAIAAKIQEATGLQAAHERAATAAAVAAERQAVLDRAAALAVTWGAWLDDADTVAVAVAGLWTRYRGIMADNTAILADVQRLDLLQAIGGYNVGSLSGAALEARQGSGMLAWRG